MDGYFVFSDEAGVYRCRPSEAHVRSHPFYIRSNVIISIYDYRIYQKELHDINNEYKIPYSEEIKWSDLWSKIKNKPRTDLIKRLKVDKLKSYYRLVFKTALRKPSVLYMFTITDMRERSSYPTNEEAYRFHLQDAMQRVQMSVAPNGFATLIIDELNEETIKQVKTICRNFTEKGDFVNYDNLYHGVLIENSLYSPGIQLADYAAGVMNGFLREMIVCPDKYQFATELYHEFVEPRLRKSPNGITVGYGMIDVPKDPRDRTLLNSIFEHDISTETKTSL